MPSKLLSEDQEEKIRELYLRGFTRDVIRRRFGITRSEFERVVKGLERPRKQTMTEVRKRLGTMPDPLRWNRTIP